MPSKSPRPARNFARRRRLLKYRFLIFFVWLSFLLPAGTALGAKDRPDEVVLGVPTSLTLLEGRESLNAVRLAVEEINADGGLAVGGGLVPVRVESVDLQDALPGVRPDEALARLDGFVREKKPHGLMVGPFRSEVLLAAMTRIARYRLPLLGTIAMSSATEDKILRYPEYKYIFRVGLNADYLVEYLAENMKLLRGRFGVGSVFILNQDVAWARSTASAIIKLYLQRRGWNVLGQITYPNDAVDFTEGLEAARDLGAEVVLCIFDSAGSGRLVKQWNAMRSSALLTGFISPLAGPGAWETFEGKIAGALNVVFELGNIPSDLYPPARVFYEKYRQRYGRPIEAGHGPAPAYEAVHVFADAVRRTGGLDPDRLAAALERTDRRGVMGRVRFHQGRQAVFGPDPEETAVGCLVQWTSEGRRRIVYPPALAEGEIESPAYMRAH